MQDSTKNSFPSPQVLHARLALIAWAAIFISTPAQAQQGSWDPWKFWPSVAIHQVHLPSDQILLWAYNGPSAWVWDVGTPLGFTEVPNLNANIFCSGHAGLDNGDYLIGGGLFINSTQLFDISTAPGSWMTKQNMATDRFYPTLTTLDDGRVTVIGGTGTAADIPEVYDPSNDTWTPLPGAQLVLPICPVLPCPTAQNPYVPIYPFMFLLPDGKLFFAGPSTITGTLDVSTQTWAFVGFSANDGASAVMYEPGKVMKCGGFAAANKTTEIIDLNAAAPVWTTSQSMDMMFARHDHSLTILPDGTVLAVGGHDAAGAAVLDAELFDPQTNTWSTMAAITIPRQYHSTSMLFRDGRVVVAGGDGFASAEVYNPPYLSAGPRPAINSAPAQVTYNQTFPLQWQGDSTIVKMTLLRLGAETHSFDQNQRYMELTFQHAIIAVDLITGQAVGTANVQAPAGPTLAPPGYYMIFVLDNQGVPSVGSYILIN